jgi:hypothetical protein
MAKSAKIVVKDGKRRKVLPASVLTTWSMQHGLGEQYVGIIMDIADDPAKERLYGFELTLAQARQFANDILSMVEQLAK